MNRKDIKRKSHQECSWKAEGRGRPRQARRHKTCPSPQEISKVMASMTLGMLAEGSCSEDELLEKCIQSFDSAGSLRRGDHILNMVLAMHSWVLPSADLAARLLTLYPPRARSCGWREEGRILRAWEMGTGEQAGLDAGQQSLDQNSSTKRPQRTHRN